MAKTKSAPSQAALGYATPAKVGGFEKYEIEDAERTLMRAAEIVANKSLLTHAMKCFKKKQQGMTRLVDVLSAHNRA